MGNVASVDGNQKSGIHSPVEEKVVDPMIYGLFFPSLVFGLGISGCHPTNHQQSVDSLWSSPADLWDQALIQKLDSKVVILHLLADSAVMSEEW